MSYAHMLVRHHDGLFLAKGHNISFRLFIYNNRQCSKYSKKYWHIIDRTTGQSIMRRPLNRFRTKSAAISAAPDELEYMLDMIETNDSFSQKYAIAVQQYKDLLSEYKSTRKEV